MNLSITHPYGGTHRLTERVLALPGMRDRYLALVKELAATAFAKERLLADLTTAEAALKGPLARDAAAMVARKEKPTPNMFAPPPDLRTFVARRTASVAAQLAGTAPGYTPRGPGGPSPGMGVMLAGPVLENRDADGDGKLSRAEWRATAERLVALWKPAADGTVDRATLAAGLNDFFPKPPEGSPPPPQGFSLGEQMAGPILARADTDTDGRLTADELLTAAGKLFDEFDKTKAGVLDEDAFGAMLNTLFPPPPGGPKGPARGERPV